MMNGCLLVQSYAARQSAPVPGVTVTIRGEGHAPVTLTTDETGTAPVIQLPAPDKALSLDEANTQQPYSLWDVTAEKEGYQTVIMQGVQVFACQTALILLEMLPAQRLGAPQPKPESFDIPPHSLYRPQGPSSVAPAQNCPAPLVLPTPIVPTTITVHLGKPKESARNVTVSFRHYIANVASSEVYPTWPEQALRANIHAQISLAMNRIFTEWYPSRGYTFNITNSTSYDQYYVHGRTVFDVMVRLTNDIFNTYIRKKGTVNPYYAEYCDGKSVSCAGLKQWGTVTLANQGKNALQILRYYYGNDVEIVRSDNIRSIPQSYPGSPLRQGSSGPAVFTLQRQLNRIAKDYPFLGKLNVDGVFGAQMASTVRAFQKQFNLTADGVVGRQTWYKISYIYVSVKDLAELTSEGETAGGTLPDGSWGGTVLRQGSRGSAVERVQFWLNTIAQYDDNIPTLTVDGIFGTGTTAAVRAFQRRHGLTVDGVVGKTTWDAIYREYRSIQSDNGTPNAYPGTPLRPGDRGQNVRLVQFWLKIARSVYSALNDVGVDGIFGPSTTAAVKKFQSYFGLASDGIVGRATWSKLYEVYNDAANDLLAPNLRPGDYPGVLRVGSSGRAVRELQFYLYILSAYQSSIPAVSIDGRFGPSTEASVRAYQKFAGLTVDGIVGRATWDSLYKRASQLRQSGPVIVFERQPWPGAPLQEGSEGPSVLYYTVLLQRIGYYFDSVQSLPLSNRYTPETVVATRSLQALLNLPVTGIVDQETWAAAEALGLQLAAFTPSGDRNAALGSQYPGYALGEGSIGPEVEQIARWLNQRAAVYCGDPFVEQSPDFTAALAAAVKAAQGRAGLLETGTVGRMTWNALRQQSSPSGTLPPEGPGPVCPPCPCAEQKEG